MSQQHVVSPENTELSCFHCGLAVTTGQLFTSTIANETQCFCCAGCQAVANLIHHEGLDPFYQHRASFNRRPDKQLIDFSVYDDSSIQASFVSSVSAEERKAYLLLDGITCAACVWLIEKYLGGIDGVHRVNINALSHACTLYFDASRVQLSQLMQALYNIGYRPQPFTQAEQQQQQAQQQRQLLLRLGFAGFGMMQVGMVAVALYAGALQGIEQQWEQLLRWVSLLVATPIVLFSAQPFWMNAWRSIKQLSVKKYHLSMDVPVSLAIILAYLTSAWATFTHSGDVYFDSISMFTFFLLLGRYCELRLRIRNQQLAGITSQLLPITANKVYVDDDGKQQQITVAVAELGVGDKLRILSGETIPADGKVVEGCSAVIEAVLTGESKPVDKTLGDEVIAGTVNTDGTLLIEVLATGQQTRLSTIAQLVNDAEQDKPYLQTMADKVASFFVAAVLFISLCVFFTWRIIDPEQALWITLSVLVVTCPCALSLATPTALTASLAVLLRKGLLVLKGHVIETLVHTNKVLFDKTGTLTQGQPSITSIDIHDASYQEKDIIAIATSLEQGSSHPIAQAFAKENMQKPYPVGELRVITGSGVVGKINSHCFRLGKADFVFTEKDEKIQYNEKKRDAFDEQYVLLTKDGQLIAKINLSDQIRESAYKVVTALKQANIPIEVLSGDQYAAVKSLANTLNIDYQWGQTPEQKLNFIREQQRQYQIIMVGDGINDVPVLAGADVSIAMGNASDFARTRADSILINNNLEVIPEAIELAKKTKQVMRQNILWAIAYNIVALPLAATGFIPPYLAAIGMSASSLIVVLNALRLYK